MRKTTFAALTIVLILFTTMAAAAQESAETSLKLIPAETMYCVRLRSPGELILKVGELLDELAIPETPPVNPLFTILTQMLDDEITDVSDLENLGLDAERDVTIFWLEPNPQNILVAVHIKERPLAEEWLTTRFGQMNEAQYNDVSYLVVPGGAFIFFDDVMLIAQDEDEGKRCIDAYLGKQPSILSVPEGASSLSLENKDSDVVGFISLQRLMDMFGPIMEMGLGGMKESMKRDLEGEQPGMMTFVALMMAQMDMGLWALQQAQSFTLALAFDAHRVQLDAAMTFKSESEVQDLLSLEPGQMKLFSALPEDAPIAGGTAIDADGMVRVAAVVLDRLIALNPQINVDDIQAQRQEFLEALRGLLDLLGDEAAYAGEAHLAGAAGLVALIGAVFATPLAQDITYVFDISDESAAENYFTDFVSRMDAFSAMFRALDIPDDANPFAGIERGDAEEYNTTSIASVHIPNYPTFPIPGMMALPQEFSLRYALKSGKLILSLSRDNRGIKNILDVLDSKKASLATAKSFQDASAALPAETNLAHYISPVGYFKSIIGFAVQMDDSIRDEQRQAIDALEGGIGIGSSMVLRDGKAEGRMYVNVGEIRDLIAGFVTLTEGDRVRQQAFNQIREYQQTGELGKMLELVGEMMETNPQDVQMVRYELVNAFSQANRLDELESYFQEAAKKYPTESGIYKMLGEIYRRRSDNTGAIEMYEKVLALNENDIEAYSSLADIYQMDGMPQKAISAYKKALELQPRATHLMSGLARAYASAGQEEEALKLAEEMKKRVGNNAHQHLQLGEIYEAAGEEERALEAFEKAVELEPQQRYLKNRLADAYERAGKDDLAAELREALRSPSRTRLPIRKKAPEFSLKTPDGKTVKLSDFRGKPIILNFWATWSPSCMKEMALLEKLYKVHKDELVIIGISVNIDDADAVKSHLGKRDITYPIVIATQDVLDEYDLVLDEPLETIPTSVAVDGKGIIQDELVGPLNEVTLDAAIRRLLTKGEPVVRVTAPPNGLIKGKVTDTQSPRPNNLADATVTLQSDLLLEKPRTVKTDAAGNYEFPNLPPGEYVITASKPGYDDSAEYVTVTPGGESFHDVRLYKSD